MRQKYALYYTFEQDSKKITLKEKKKMLVDIEKLGEVKKEALFLLVCEHYINCGNVLAESNFIIPYEGKQTQEGIVFDINKFPSELVKILYKFIQIQN